MSLENKWRYKHDNPPDLRSITNAGSSSKNEHLNVENDILIVLTNNKNLCQQLQQWANKTNSTIVYNPENNILETEQKFFAIVVDSDLINLWSIPKNLSERLIPAELQFSLIEKILQDLKPGYQINQRIKR